MTDFKSMYYYLAGRMASAIDTLEASTDMLEANARAIEAIAHALEANSKAITKVKEKLKSAQQITEDMFINQENDDEMKTE